MFGRKRKDRVDALIGKSVMITVGEPWNFKSKDGENVLRGIIEAVDEAQNNGLAGLYLRTTSFDFDGATYDRILAGNRDTPDGNLAGSIAGARSLAAQFYTPDGCKLLLAGEVVFS